MVCGPSSPVTGFLAEESGAHRCRRRDRAPPRGQGVGRVWVVDPLDGTINYAHGLPFFCVSIGLVVDGRAAVGVVFDPARGELYEAAGGRRHAPRRRCRPAHARQGAAWRSAWSRSPCRCRGWRAGANEPILRAHAGEPRAGQLGAGPGLRGRRALRRLRPGAAACPPGTSAAAGLDRGREAGATVTDLAGGPWLDVARGSHTVAVLARGPPPYHAALLRLLAGSVCPRRAAA